MNRDIVIHWFRQDLRIADNPALSYSVKKGVVLPIYIFDNKNPGEFEVGSVSRWWLHHSLSSLSQSLNKNLCVYIGDPKKILIDLIEEHNIKAVYWNRCYEPWQIKRDIQIKKVLDAHNTESKSFNGSLLWEPWDILKADGTPYKVFTPYYRNGCLRATIPRVPISKPSKLKYFSDAINKTSINKLSLLPKHGWYKKLETHWNIGEEAAQSKLKKFSSNNLTNYKKGRDFPSFNSVSRLSPHLHFGEISANQAWYAAKKNEDNDDLDHFLSELGWREFSHSLLYHFPELPQKNFQTKFNHFPWLEDKEKLERWQKGLTGYPLVDAGMRELWQTGYMHNRIRMIVGSFLVKNLLQHWQHGEKWFWDCLADADLANNSAGWQWVAGCGADAAPYFRVFNPITQGKKFDPSGVYTRKFIPELKRMPDKYLFNPWEAPIHVLDEAGVNLGKDYPKPIIDIKLSRERALQAYQSLKKNN